ncbi:hypothetical protein LNP20_02450 [Klebsiella pneumoniae subsp. pneumoniae]|nr:hypothetical protein [Klebsiella pneumoniae subsp. pneumoniae]
MAAPKTPASPALSSNKLNAPVDDQGPYPSDLSEIFRADSSKAKIVKVDPAPAAEGSTLPVLGTVPWSFDLIATRAIDMAHHLNATIINRRYQYPRA